MSKTPNLNSGAALVVAIGAASFGFLGIPVRFLGDNGFSAMDITMVRHLVTAVALFVIILVVDRSLLRARPRDVLLFALFGAFKLMSDVTLFKSQMLIDLSLSALLQMTAPYYVMVFSLFLFKERITIQKMITVIVAFIGCILVTGIVTGKHDDLNFVGIACAYMSGLFFGMFTLGCKIGTDRQYAPMTTMFYIFLFATLFSLPLADDAMVLRSFANAEMLLYILVLGFVLSLLPFYCTTWGVKRLEVTKASLISVMELVTAAIVGAAVFGEELSAPRIVGMFLVILSIVIMDVKIWGKIREHRRSKGVSADGHT